MMTLTNDALLDYVTEYGSYDCLSTLPLADGEASTTATCLACRGRGSRVSYVESSTGAVVDVDCPACGGFGVVESVDYCPGEACHDKDLADLHDYEVMQGTY